MENTFFLEVHIGEYNPIIHRFGFETYDKAMEQLKLIQPKVLGPDVKFKNDPDTQQHVIVADDGQAVVAIHLIQLVRVIDRAKYRALTEYTRETEMSDHLRALGNGGIEKKIDAADYTRF